MATEIWSGLRSHSDAIDVTDVASDPSRTPPIGGLVCSEMDPATASPKIVSKSGLNSFTIGCGSGVALD
jgi:hypothetical protein